MDLYCYYELCGLFNKDYNSIMGFVDNYLEIASVVAKKSKDRSTKVGCVIVSSRNNHILSTGYNGFLRNFDGDDDDENHERDRKYKLTIHAERNAIYAATKKGISLDDSVAFVTAPPCHECTLSLLQSGIHTMIFYEGTEDFLERFHDSLEIATELCDRRFIYNPKTKEIRLSEY